MTEPLKVGDTVNVFHYTGKIVSITDTAVVVDAGNGITIDCQISQVNVADILTTATQTNISITGVNETVKH